MFCRPVATANDVADIAISHCPLRLLAPGAPCALTATLHRRWTLSYPNTAGKAFNVSAHYPSLIRFDPRHSTLETDREQAPASWDTRSCHLSLSLLELKELSLLVFIGGCSLLYLYTNATRPRCCCCSERCRLSVTTLYLLLRLGLLGISTASVQDAEADRLDYKTHNLGWNLYRRHW